MGPFKPLPMKEGDVLIYDNYMPHKSAPNKSKKDRRAMFAVYNAKRHGRLREKYYANEAENRRKNGSSGINGKANIFFTGLPVLSGPKV